MRTDEELMKSYQEGSDAAWSELFIRYSPKVYGFIQKRLRHEELEDFYQIVWRELHEKRNLYRQQPFLPWFFVFIQYLLVEKYHSLGRQRERLEAQKIHERDKEKFDIDVILERLPAEHREMVKKHYQDDINFPELEKEIGYSQNITREHLSRTRDYIDFLSSSESPPVLLSSAMQREIPLFFRSKNIFWKFIVLELIGAFLSLTFCPQLGIGPQGDGGPAHFFRSVGDVALALFSSSVFIFAGLTIAFIFMKGQDIWWLWRRQKNRLLIFPALLWGGLLLINVCFKLPRESFLYHGSWILCAIAMQAIYLKFRIGIFHWQQEDS
jgi:DNA-directed RNA polymerase specialized sigma24 family protein